jgi:hypothetical protein
MPLEVSLLICTALELIERGCNRLYVEGEIGRRGQNELCFVIGVVLLSETMRLYFELFEASINLHAIY